MVDKVEDPQPTDEPRMTFDYSRVPELLPGSHLELSSKVHDHLSNPRHGYLFSADLKHAYLTIPLHKDDRHYFAFTISGIGQLQPKRMQQGSKSAGFTMNELVYRAFGFIPSPNPEPSLLHSDDPAIPPALTFYMDDFFGGFRDFEDQFSFLIDHFFPRIDWAKLVLAFRKLRLFAKSIKALGVTHTVGGLVNVLEDRVAKIARWPVPKDQTGVRAFLGTIGITRRWVKNFSELARPLSRLTGKVDFRWTQAEQFSFEILRVKCSTQSSMHGIDLSHEVHFYTDASGFGAGLAVTQYQTTQSAKGFSLVEVPIIYDSFTFNVSQRKYPTYKKELCALVKFCQKYDYLCKHPYLTTIIHTDHRPLVHFLKSDIHEGIYGHWADVLRRLNITIRYIPGPRNKVADGLSRTVFDEDFKFQDLTEGEKEPLRKWSDGKSGYQSFLRQLDEQQYNEVLVDGTLGGSEVFLSQAKAPAERPQAHSLPRLAKASWQEAYRNSNWFGRLYQAHDLDPTSVVLTPYECTQALSYRLDAITGILWKDHRGSLLPCIPESLVLSILRATHDDAGHWAKAGTMAKLREFVYWPDQTQDVERYIAGCMACARHGPATRSQLLQPIAVHGPFRLLGIDFIGPLPTSKNGNRFILHTICYFSRFSSGFPRKTANAEDVISAFEELFFLYGKPKGFYWDSGQHFISQEVQDFLTMAGIGFSYSRSGSSMSTGMVEVGNKILEDVLRKEDNWEATFRKSIRSLNSRIIKHLTYAPCEILLGLPPVAGPATKKRKTTDNEQCGDAKAPVAIMTRLGEAPATDDPSPNGKAGPVNKKRKTTDNEQRGNAKAPVASMTGLGKASATNNHRSLFGSPNASPSLNQPLFGNPEIGGLQASGLPGEHLDNHLPPSGTGDGPGSLPPNATSQGLSDAGAKPGRHFRIPKPYRNQETQPNQSNQQQEITRLKGQVRALTVFASRHDHVLFILASKPSVENNLAGNYDGLSLEIEHSIDTLRTAFPALATLVTTHNSAQSIQETEEMKAWRTNPKH